jgi:hypothetical protein
MSLGLQQEVSVGLVGVRDHDHSEVLLLAASGEPLFSRDVHGRFILPPHAVPTGVDLAFETPDRSVLPVTTERWRNGSREACRLRVCAPA